MSAKVAIDSEAVTLLARVLTESDLSEIEYKQGETHIRVVRNASPVTFHHPVASASLAAPTLFTAPVLEESPVSQGSPIKSPLVGTVYVSPEPSAPPFVQKGKQVKEGDVLFIVEAMKVMNPIRAPKAGVVKEVCVENGMPVEFDQVLLYLDI